MQDSHEIVDGLLRNKPVGRMGLNDFPWVDTLEKWAAGENYPTKEDGNPVEPVDYFDFDFAGCGGWFDIMPVKGDPELLEETDEWKIERNGAGAALKTWKNKSGTPEHIDFLMTSRAVWERDYRHHLLEPDRDRLEIEHHRQELAKRKAENRWTFYASVCVWETMRQSMGDVCMYESLALDHDWIHDFNRVYTDFYKAHFKILIEEAGMPDGIWLFEDLGYHKGLFCSPNTLESLIFPYYKEMVDFFHGYDLPVILHSCGGVGEALDLVVTAGFDAVNPMEVKAGNDIVKFAKDYGDQLAFIGGLDARILESGDRDRIRSEVIHLCTTLKDLGARFVFGSDHSISTNVNLSDFSYAISVYKEYMTY